MKVFISWSGETSKSLAEILKEWLPRVIQKHVEPFYSASEIKAGARWTSVISKELQDTKFGIICLTRENLDAPWIHFEAGALSKQIEQSLVCPLLFGIEPTEIRGPLLQFQATRFGKTGMKRIVKSINDTLDASDTLDQHFLEETFEIWWPKLKPQVDAVLSVAPRPQPDAARSDRDLLEEILTLSRSLVQPTSGPTAIDELAALGVHTIHSERPPADDLQTLIREAEQGTTIRLLGVCMMGFTNAPMQKILTQKLEDGCRVRFLTLDSRSKFVEQRALEENREENDIRSDIFSSNQIHQNFIDQRVPENLRGNIELRHYDSPPNCFLLGTESKMLASFYLREQRGEFLPHIELHYTKNGIWTAFENHFESLWKVSQQIAFPDRSEALRSES